MASTTTKRYEIEKNVYETEKDSYAGRRASASEITAVSLQGISFDQNKPSAVVEYFIKLGVDKYHSSFFVRLW
jgi:hypothetical protein